MLTFPEEGGIAKGWAHAGSLFIQAAYAWMMTLGLMGLFRTAMGEGNARVRYLSDASYWLYLIHLPLIIALQGCGAGLAAAFDRQAGAADRGDGGGAAAVLPGVRSVHASGHAAERQTRARPRRRGLTTT